jgi:hypothetical protein
MRKDLWFKSFMKMPTDDQGEVSFSNFCSFIGDLEHQARKRVIKSGGAVAGYVGGRRIQRS